MENDKELCTSKIKNIAKSSYTNFKEFIKNEGNQKMFFVVIFAFTFAILIGIIIGSKENFSMKKTILICIIISIPLILFAILFPKQFIPIICVFSVFLIILGNRITDTTYNVGYYIIDTIVWIMNNISEITLKFLKIDINFQENMVASQGISRKEVDDSYDSRRLQTHYQNVDSDGNEKDIINQVLNSFRTNDTKIKMKNEQQEIIKLEKEIENIFSIYSDNILDSTKENESTQNVQYEGSTLTMTQLRNLYDIKKNEIDNKKRLFQDTYGKYNLIRFDLQNNSLPPTLPIYNRPNKFRYGSQSYIPTYEDQVLLSASSQKEKPSFQFKFYKINKCLNYDDFSNTL